MAKRQTILAAADAPITAAGTVNGSAITLPSCNHLMIMANFDYGSGGTAVKVYIETSIDDGVTWHDIMSFAFTTADAKKVSKVSRNVALAPAVTPAIASLADNTILDGLIGPKIRVSYVSTGTYGGSTSLRVDMFAA